MRSGQDSYSLQPPHTCRSYYLKELDVSPKGSSKMKGSGLAGTPELSEDESGLFSDPLTGTQDLCPLRKTLTSFAPLCPFLGPFAHLRVYQIFSGFLP